MGQTRAGATTVNLPDTVGVLHPIKTYDKIKKIIETIKARELDTVFSVHNHDDLGMATANTLYGLMAGASQAEVTINGIGERAGNASLEEVVAGLIFFNIGKSNVNTRLIGPTSRMVAEYTRKQVAYNKAIVGRNAFAHEAGIHQDGVIKAAETYEIMDPLLFGVESIITFGPRSGRNALRANYTSIGINLSDEEFQQAAVHFSNIADEVVNVDAADLIRAVKKGEAIPNYYELVSYSPIIGTTNFGSVIKMKINGVIQTAYGEGNGQVDAAANAIKQIVGNGVVLDDFHLNSEGKGSDGVGITDIVLTKNSWQVNGRGENTDSVTSAITALVDGLNRLKYIEEYFEGK